MYYLVKRFLTSGLKSAKQGEKIRKNQNRLFLEKEIDAFKKFRFEKELQGREGLLLEKFCLEILSNPFQPKYLRKM